MTVNSGNKMIFYVRIFVACIFLIAEAQLGLSQNIIYEGELREEDNISSPIYLSQNFQQPSLPPTQVPFGSQISPLEEKKEILPVLNLFDLTTTLKEEEFDNQTKIMSVDGPYIIGSDGKDAKSDNLSSREEKSTNINAFENDIISNPKNSISSDNTTNFDQLISELFPAEATETGAENYLQSDNTSNQFVTKNVFEEQVQPDADMTSQNVTVGLRELSGLGLVTTGIADWQERKMPFSTLLWAGSTPDNIQYLYKISEPYGSSKTINSLVYSSVIRKSAPPIGVAGNTNLSQSLVISRMEWLARAGRSEALADFIRKLPEDDKRWDEWQRWLGAYDLLSYNDLASCEKADKKVSQQFDAFWLKVQILCRVIDGAYDDALFLAELMNTSGEEDPLFFELLGNVQARLSSNLISAQSSLTPLHLSLMDLAQAPIEWHQISELPASMMHASNLIKNTTREARLAFAMKKILQQSETTFEDSALIRSLHDVELPLETAYSILQNTRGDLRLIASAEIYSALAGNMFQAEIQEDYDLLFLETFTEEVKFGNGKALLPLYADLAKTRLSATSLPSLSLEIKTEFEKLVMLDEIEITLSQDILSLPDKMYTLLFLISDKETQKSLFEVLQELGLWHLVPIFEQANIIEKPASWLEVASLNTEKPMAYQSLELEPILKKALIEASENQRTAETVLIISALIENHNLNHISASDLALVIKALQEIGFDDVANELFKEIIISNLLDLHWGEST